MSQAAALSADDHGIADWPSGAAFQLPLPDNLPDGRSWPRIMVTVLTADSREACEATLASVSGQGYPNLALAVRSEGTTLPTGTDAEPDYRLWLRDGDLLAPGALVALCTEAVLTGAAAVAGLRVLFEHGVHRLDVLAEPARADEEPERDLGDVLFARSALERLGLSETAVPPSSSAVWTRLTAAAEPLSRVGRPVLVRASPAASAQADGLSVVSLTDLGYGGGAGIAHRRLTEALALSGHRVEHRTLAAESPAAAAEWTDRFPRTEAAITAGRHDLVLAGNLHGVTRGGGLVARLSQAVPTALALHDLFAFTGRCAHPKDCPVITTGCDVRCPTPADYPQLQPDRIAGAFREKRAALAARAAPLLLANSDWTLARAEALAPDTARIARIQLAFPTGVFRPRDRVSLRRRLGLPENDVLILFAAVIADAPDKGFDDLVATMARVARPGIGFVAVGRLDNPASFGLEGLHAPGLIGNEELLAQWYAACDIYLTASRLETLGQTPIEAGLCGTPTVAYRATGLTSAVIDGVTGLLVEPRPGALAEGLEQLIVDAALRQRLGAFARIVLESRFSHAAASISLHRALAGWPGMRSMPRPARIGFCPEMLGQFAYAQARTAGATGLIAAPSHPFVRALRRAKHTVLGRGMPLWARRALYAAVVVRRRLAR